MGEPELRDAIEHSRQFGRFQEGQKNTHEPDRRKSPRAHTLWTLPSKPPGVVQDPLKTDFLIKLKIKIENQLKRVPTGSF